MKWLSICMDIHKQLFLQYNKCEFFFNLFLFSPRHWTLSIQQLSRQFTMLCLLLTIVASAIMFKDWSGQNISSIASEICGFITVISGTILLHSTKEQDVFPSTGSMSWVIGGLSQYHLAP
ncbi:hypothetical protein ZIOFF_023665 [Zingiber officinale]|uniref:Probable magnesium transporter n=1 Tax=Zingiber officinale TaxID=94328 RepID=A0A8J5GZD7_ZINOF|nr:hypothetical protein ZIOFF_023665 [Zingiber officinale]